MRANFERYGLLDDRVRFLEGWFADTPRRPDRADRGAASIYDLYGSTMGTPAPSSPIGARAGSW